MSTTQPSQQETTEKPRTIVNSKGEFVSVNETACDLYGYDKDTLLSMSVIETLAYPKPEHGRQFEQMLYGDLSEVETNLICAEGSIISVECQVSTTKVDGERCIRSEIEVLETIRPATEKPFSSINTEFCDPLAEIASDNILEKIQNLRVDDGETSIPLDKVIQDLVVGHNEVHDYKHGAYNLSLAIDDRLKEEEKRNPDSVECRILREAKALARSLHQRIQQGDLKNTD